MISVTCRDNNDCKEGGEICQGGKCLPGCRRNKDCKEEENCQNGSCVDICNPPNAQDGKSPLNPCGTNALCKSTKHMKQCSCPPNHLGNPEVECITEKKGRLKSVKGYHSSGKSTALLSFSVQKKLPKDLAACLRF